MVRQDRCGARSRTNITGKVHRDAVEILQREFIEQAQNQGRCKRVTRADSINDVRPYARHIGPMAALVKQAAFFSAG